jgi:hypothetical protein
VSLDLDSPGTQAGLGELVGVTQQAISAMGVPPGTLRQMLLAYCGHLREEAAGRATGDSMSLARERAALAREQRYGLEIKNATLRGEYAAVALLSEVLATASQAVAERFDHLPGLLKKACPSLSDADREHVVGVIASARNEWVRATAALVTSRVPSTDDEGAPEASPLGLDDGYGPG